MNGLFSIAYFPPISYLLNCLHADEICLDQHEHFVKQTYRNRCCIYGANGKQALIIPVVHTDLFRIPIREVKMSFDSPWKNIHWKAICSAYRNSPYFEFYEEELKNIFQTENQLLFDFNFSILQSMLKLFLLKKTVSLTTEYQKEVTGYVDFRKTIHPKSTTLSIPSYQQVFGERNGFLNDLSCLDYLFNEGNDLTKISER